MEKGGILSLSTCAEEALPVLERMRYINNFAIYLKLNEIIAIHLLQH
jgi:hypothetical protein